MVDQRQRLVLVSIALALVVSVIALVIWASRDSESSADLADIETDCGVDGNVTLNESGTTLRFHFDGQRAPREELRCALEALRFPGELDDGFPQGGGTAEWDGLTLVWSLTGDGHGPVAISRLSSPED